MPLRHVATTVAMAGAWLLLVAGVGHCRDRRWLRAVLAAQGLVPVGLRASVIALLGPGELLLGADCLLAVLMPGDRWLAAVPLVGLALLYALYTVVMVVLLRRAPGSPCGCFGDDEPAGWAGAARNLVVTCAALVCVAAGPARRPWSLVALAAGAVLAAVLWLAPRTRAAGRAGTSRAVR